MDVGQERSEGVQNDLLSPQEDRFGLEDRNNKGTLTKVLGETTIR